MMYFSSFDILMSIIETRDNCFKRGFYKIYKKEERNKTTHKSMGNWCMNYCSDFAV